MYSYMNDRKVSNKIKDDLINNLQRKVPIITISQNGSTDVHESYTVNIKIEDGGNGVDSRFYTWSTSNNAQPDIELATNDENVTTPHLTGDFYLIVKACSRNNNCSTVVSKPFSVEAVMAQNVSYNNANTNVDCSDAQCMINYLDGRIKRKELFATSNGIYLRRNNTLNYFKTNNFQNEKTHLQSVFTSSACYNLGSVMMCQVPSEQLTCGVGSSGWVECIKATTILHVGLDGTISNRSTLIS